MEPRQSPEVGVEISMRLRPWRQQVSLRNNAPGWPAVAEATPQVGGHFDVHGSRREKGNYGRATHFLQTWNLSRNLHLKIMTFRLATRVRNLCFKQAEKEGEKARRLA